MGLRFVGRRWISTLTLTASLGTVTALFAANAEPLYPLSTDPVRPLTSGTTTRMARDWSSQESHEKSRPDRSFRNIWVRVFPLLSLPLGDPYPDTQNVNAIALSNPEGLSVYSLSDQRVIGRATALSFDFVRGRVDIGGTSTPLEPLWIVPEDGTVTELVWDKGMTLPKGGNAEVRVQFRGGFVVKLSTHISRDNSHPPRELWSVINVVLVNDYLQSVVPSEVISSWNPETLRAQAIAARTYGLYEVGTARLQGLDFDVDPSTWYQSYQGYRFWNRDEDSWRTIELSPTSEAVRDTRGEVILHGNEIIKAYFSSNSGGRTCTANECLELPSNPPYLAEVDDHPDIKEAPGGSWGTRATITSEKMRERLLYVGITPEADPLRLEHLERSPSGRTWRLRVVLANGSTIALDRYQTRKMMHIFGPIRSFQYNLGLVASDGKQKISGHGYGHAVGLSQWGAQLFSKRGWNAHRILKHYYHDVNIADLSAAF
ncbi:MAG: SpoIID/LytB domain-containing protein [Bdellovibrionales bacterium]